jgi:hypothetical protein
LRGNDEKAALRLERAMPLVHTDLRAALEKTPNAKGAPRMRLILSLFDDVPMPALGPDAGP